MMDLLDNTDVMCKTCKVAMQRGHTLKNGFKLRSFMCPKCKAHYLHPVDLEKYTEYNQLKEKQFNMKLRMIGNSFCISIPREIIRFNHIQENSIVSLSMEDPEKIRLIFHKQTTIHTEDEK